MDNNIKSLEIHRSTKVSAHFLLNEGDDKEPPALKLELKFHNGTALGRIKQILGLDTKNIYYTFDRKDVDEVRSMIREYEGLYDGWIDSKDDEQEET